MFIPKKIILILETFMFRMDIMWKHENHTILKSMIVKCYTSFMKKNIPNLNLYNSIKLTKAVLTDLSTITQNHGSCMVYHTMTMLCDLLSGCVPIVCQLMFTRWSMVLNLPKKGFRQKSNIIFQILLTKKGISCAKCCPH